MLLLLSGCGLERFLVLNPPEAIPSPANPWTFQFRKTKSNSEIEFWGFEVYYKIYGPGEIPASDSADIATFDQLAGRFYRRLNNPLRDQENSYAKPLIDMRSPDYDANRAAQFIITVDFMDLTSAMPTLYPKIYSDAPIILTGSSPDVWAPIPIAIDALRRDVTYSEPTRELEFKRFSNESTVKAFASTDLLSSGGDLGDAAWAAISASPNQAQMGLFVMSYGYDLQTSSTLYSLPVFLGSINNIPFPIP